MYIFDFILQLSFSITLGFIIGLERQLTGHLAGIRTNILICFGSCLFITTFNHQFSFRNSSYRKLYYFRCGFFM
jgi:uncharacterized membrane protein YhiD involved in acid resistance